MLLKITHFPSNTVFALNIWRMQISLFTHAWKKTSDCCVPWVIQEFSPASLQLITLWDCLVKNEFCLIPLLKNMQQVASQTNCCCKRAVHRANTACETNQYCNHQCNLSNPTPGSINTLSSQMTTVEQKLLIPFQDKYLPLQCETQFSSMFCSKGRIFLEISQILD